MPSITFENGCVRFIKDDYKKVNGRQIKQVYSDRLKQWNYELYMSLSEKYFGGGDSFWNSSDQEKLEEFLKEYFNKDVDFIRVEEFENVSNGYPYWLITYCEN